MFPRRRIHQLKLEVGDFHAQTQSHPYFVGAREDLREKLKDNRTVKISAYCKYLIEFNPTGETDERHDLLYCFRDVPDLIEQVMAVYPARVGYAVKIYTPALPDVDAFHSCPFFIYTLAARKMIS